MLYSQIGLLASCRSGAGTLLLARARPHASAAPSATAHALYSRSKPCFHAQSTCLPSLAARNRRNDSARSVRAEPVALRAGDSTLYAKWATIAGTAIAKMRASVLPRNAPNSAAINEPAPKKNNAAIAITTNLAAEPPLDAPDGGRRFHHPDSAIDSRSNPKISAQACPKLALYSPSCSSSP